jgi:hypothetical protein
MSTNNDTSSFQSALSEITEAVAGGSAVPPVVTAAALASAPSEFQGQGFDAVVEALPTLVSASNWERFSWQEKQLEKGTPPALLDDKWKEFCGYEPAEAQEALSEESRALQEADREMQKAVRALQEAVKHSTDMRTQIRRYETHLGFADNLARVICDTIVPPDGGAPARIRLQELLPQGLLPQYHLDVGDSPYDHTLHLFVRDLLTRLGPIGRRLPQVVKACGRILALLFPDENDDPEGSFVFRQDLFRVQDYLDRHSNDMLALCWRGELAYWEGGQCLAEQIAQQVWEATQHASPAVIASLVCFFALAQEGSYFWWNLDWGIRNSHFYGGYFGGIRSDWHDREEDLALAVIRRAVGQGRWDRGFLEALARLQADSSYDLPNDLLPAECWVWLAENAANFSMDSLYPYYKNWHAAFETSAGEPSSDISFLSSIVILAGCLLGSSTSQFRIALKPVLERLESLVAHPQHGRPSWCALGAAHDLLSQLPMRQLTSADRLALKTVWRRVETSWKEVGRKVSDEDVDTVEQIQRFHYPRLREQAESQMRKHLGERLWNVLGKKTQDYLWRGQAQYDQESELDGDEPDFASAILQFSNALLNEIVLRFWKPVSGNSTSRDDARKAYPGRGDPEWGDFVRMFEALEKGLWPSIVTVAQSKGVMTKKLIDTRLELEFLRKEGRTKFPHRKLIDRELAAVLYDKLIHKGLMKTVCAALHGL